MTAPHQTPAEQRILADFPQAMPNAGLDAHDTPERDTHHGDTGRRPSVEQWLADECEKTARMNARHSNTNIGE